ncbi:hypothetical protein AB7M42_005049 [Bradyrhizobium diazoefficiens]
MIEQPHFDRYSVLARICFGVAVILGAALIAVAIVGVYFL